ncbi:hypothetical protein Stube_33820 [Streptomyces tubercidicus]|uniref:Uncharacterized protein n=1 Tax=Streptomyces tubercidicus TaxID=47759 RepID=A0A640USF5_9ACTN|nr:hypothetical protein Stube_33820 [Streptomyces tubercidicus]
MRAALLVHADSPPYEAGWPIGEPPDGLLTATETIVWRGTGAAWRFLVPWDIPIARTAGTCEEARSPGQRGPPSGT